MSEPARIALRVSVEGRVQGVGFRWHTRLEARALRVDGWVRNEDDGSVTAFLEGAPADVDAAVQWMRKGPSGARVDSLDAEEQVPTGDRGFSIR